MGMILLLTLILALYVIVMAALINWAFYIFHRVSTAWNMRAYRHLQRRQRAARLRIIGDRRRNYGER